MYMYAMPNYAGSGTHCFVFWLDEGTVTVVKRKQVQADVVVIEKKKMWCGIETLMIIIQSSTL